MSRKSRRVLLVRTGAAFANTVISALTSRALLLAAVLLALPSTIHAETLRVGIHEKPPYALKNPDGSWSGLGVEVWRAIAADADLEYDFVETPYESIIPGIAAGNLDAGVGEMEVSADAAQDVDFTQPYIISTVGVALPARSLGEAWKQALSEFMSWSMARLFLGILAALLIVSILVWLAERRHHTGHFRGGIHGFGSAFWFSAVTMTTVGYGDKTPSTFLGRAIAIAWMLVGVLLVSAFTATVTASMSATRIGGSLSSIINVHNLTCGVLAGSGTEKILRNIGINTIAFEDLRTALAELGSKRIQAVVADRQSLLYYQRHSGSPAPVLHMRIADLTLRETFIAIPVRKGQGNYEKINQALLDFTSSPSWEALLKQWTGPDSTRL